MKDVMHYKKFIGSVHFSGYDEIFYGKIEGINDLVTFEAGHQPDWEKVRSLFIQEAVIVLRTSRDSITRFSVEGFVNDFIRLIERAKVVETGF